MAKAKFAAAEWKAIKLGVTTWALKAFLREAATGIHGNTEAKILKAAKLRFGESIDWAKVAELMAKYLPVLLTLLTLLIACLLPATAHARGPWRPSIQASVDRDTIKLGESATITYSTKNASSVQRDATWWAPFVGESDGIVIPVAGQYTVTPEKRGEFTTVIRAFRRAKDLNRDGRADGARRSATVELTIEVK